MAEYVSTSSPEAITAIASEPSPHGDSTVGGMFAPKQDPDDSLPSAEEGAMGVIGLASFGGPAGGNAPGPSPGGGVGNDIYDVSPEEPLSALAPWEGGITPS